MVDFMRYNVWLCYIGVLCTKISLDNVQTVCEGFRYGPLGPCTWTYGSGIYTPGCVGPTWSILQLKRQKFCLYSIMQRLRSVTLRKSACGCAQKSGLEGDSRYFLGRWTNVRRATREA